MDKFFLLITFLLFIHLSSYTQTDSIMAFKLQRISDSDKPVERIINPSHEIKIKTKNNIKYHIEKLIFLTDSTILINNDTILLSNIFKIREYTKGMSSPLKLFFVNVGTTLINVAVAIRLANPYGGSADYNNIVEYEQQSNTLKKIGFLGGILIACGVIIPNYRYFDTEHVWILKTGYFKYENKNYN